MTHSSPKFETVNQFDQNISHNPNEIPVEVVSKASSESLGSPESADELVETQVEDSLSSQARNEERAVEIAASISQTESKLGKVREKLGLPHDAELSQNIPSIEHARKIQYGLQGPLIKEQRDMIVGKQYESGTRQDDVPQEDYLDSDPRLKDVEDELIADWEKIYGSRYDKQGIQKAEFQNFMYGTRRNPKSLDQRAQESFATRFPNASKEYALREKTRVYDKPSDDPAIKKFERDMTFSTNENLKGLSDRAYTENRAGISKAQELRSIRAFIYQYPEKAIAYGQKPGFEFFVDFIASEKRNNQRNAILEREEKARGQEEVRDEVVSVRTNLES